MRARMTPDDQAYVVALVYAWLMTHPEHYMTYVGPYNQLRYEAHTGTIFAVTVGAHYRRRAAWKRVPGALGCVCVFERLVVPRGLGQPVIAVRQRRNNEGDLIPWQQRTVAWA